MPEWDSYACEIPKPVGLTAKPCSKLTEVHHVIHMPGARRILEDGRIRAGLVYDESRLKRSRLCVAWLSANTWAYGSIYGNVQFTLDWRSIIKGRQVYWVEAMTEYNPSAYRLLLTDRDLAKSKHVQVYDPATDDGPLKRKGSTWYWNSEYTSEFMVEADLPLNLCRKVSFIRHHNTICRRNGRSCPDKKASPTKTGGRVMAFILGNATQRLKRAVNVAEDNDLAFIHTWGAIHLGYAYAMWDRTEEALAILRPAVERSEALGLPFGHIWCLNSLAFANLQAGALEHAVRHSRNALDRARIHKCRWFELVALRQLGTAYARMDAGRPDEAEKSLLQAVELAKRLAARPDLAHCQRLLGELYRTQRREQDARRQLSAASDLYRSMGMTFWLSRTETLLANESSISG